MPSPYRPHEGDRGPERPARPVGILTDRDLVIEVLAETVDMNVVAVCDVMIDELVTAGA